MTRKNIIQLPDKALRKPSQPASVPSKEIAKLCEQMARATLDWEDHREHEVGIALAAIQVNEPKQVVIVRKDLEDKDSREFDVYINPKITRYEGVPVLEIEGCLSVKDIYAEIPRYPKVKVKALDLNGRPIKLVAKGFLARVFQHEIDHTEGLTLIDRAGEEGSYFKIGREGNMKSLTEKERLEFFERSGYKIGLKTR